MQKKIVWSVFLVLIAFTFSCDLGPWRPPTTTPQNPLIKKTEFGRIEGIEDDFDTYSWRSVPFAAPPVGDKRWKAPQDPQPWKDVLETKEFSGICPQYVTDPSDPTAPATIQGNEDCLYLNVWEPKQETPKALPVYVWIHGGGNSIQMPFNSNLKGAKLAQMSDMVVVSFNYRLGPMGWFVHPALKTGDALDDSGNFGTLDIIKVLQWVKKNIHTFGGDPDNVTIAGESAGGMNIMSLVISEAAQGLFHKAIVESGGAMTATMEAGEEHADMLLAKLLVNDGEISDPSELEEYLADTPKDQVREYLLSKSAEDYLKCYDVGQGGMVSTPNIFQDGTVIPADGFNGLATGNYANKVPMIIGANTFEAKLFLYQSPAFQSVQTGQPSPYLIEKYGDVTQEILDSQSELYGLVSKYASDFMIASGVDENVRKLARAKDQPPVYAYQFNWGAALAPGEGVLPDPLGYLLGACHGMEIDFFFRLATEEARLKSGMFGMGYTAENKPGRESLENAVTDYISTFVRTGDPNRTDSGLPVWSPWKVSLRKAPKRIIFDADLNTQTIQMSTTANTLLGVILSMRAEPRYDEMEEFMTKFMEAFGGL